MSSGTVACVVRGGVEAKIWVEAPVRLEEGIYIAFTRAPSTSLTVTGRNFWDLDLEKQDIRECPYSKQTSQRRSPLHKNRSWPRPRQRGQRFSDP